MRKHRIRSALRRCLPLAFAALLPACVGLTPPETDAMSLVTTRWEHKPESREWTEAALKALDEHGIALVATVPGDAAQWCPGYAEQDASARKAFWVGLLSALAKHESTWNPAAVGGGGRWFGLTQISPSTARLYGCNARSGAALKTGTDNLSCAIRIMSHTVPRDGVVSRGMRGVAADWGPFHSSSKRSDMMNWVRAQPYCQKPQPKTIQALLNAR